MMRSRSGRPSRIARDFARCQSVRGSQTLTPVALDMVAD